MPVNVRFSDMPPYNPDLFAMVGAAAVFAPRGLPRAKLDDIGVFEHVADAHVDTFAGGGRAQSAQKLRDEWARSCSLVTRPMRVLRSFAASAASSVRSTLPGAAGWHWAATFRSRRAFNVTRFFLAGQWWRLQNTTRSSSRATIQCLLLIQSGSRAAYFVVAHKALWFK